LAFAAPGRRDQLKTPASEGRVMSADRSSSDTTSGQHGVLKIKINDKAALHEAYMPFLDGGGIFIPTNRQYRLGEDVFMLLSLMDGQHKIAVQGKVVWITPDAARSRRQTQGIGVQFTRDETGAAARAAIESILGETLASNRPTRTM
jgi:type IV pilus assembly protein PilZ